MTQFVAWIVRHPAISLILALLIAAAAMLPIRRLNIDAATQALIDDTGPAKAVYDDFIDAFGSDTLTVVVIAHPNGDAFQPETIRYIDELSYAMETYPGVVGVRSLTTALQPEGDGETIRVNRLFEEIPDDPASYARAKSQALANPTLLGNVVSTDGRFAAVNIRTDDGGDEHYATRFLDELDRVIAEHGGVHETYYVGEPRFNVAFDAAIKHDQVTLVPIAVGAILFVLWLAFRDKVALALPVVAGGLSIAAALGVMAWLGFSVNAVSVMVPSVLIVVGCTEDVHLLADYVRNLRDGREQHAAASETLRHAALPMCLTALTTVAGFAALALNDIPAIREFGLACCFGLILNFIFTLLIASPLFRWLKPPKPRPEGGRRLDAALQRVVALTVKRRAAILTTAAVVAALAIIGALRLRTDNDPIAFFKRDAPIRIDFERVHRDLSGGRLFHIAFETARPGDAKEPAVLRQVAAAQSYLAEMGLFDQSLSLVDFLALMNREMTGDPAAPALPETRAAVAEYALLMEGEGLSRFLDADDQRLSVAVRHHINGSWEMRRALERVRQWLDQNVGVYTIDGETRRLTWEITGESILIHRAADAMVAGQVESLSLALTLIFAIMCLLFLSFKAGLIALVANALPIVMNFGLMGWLGLPLNTGTCLIATIALGVAVDDTIHFMVRYQRALRETNDQKRALMETVRYEGRPIVTTSAALTLGFAALVFSPMMPTVHFGVLAALIMIYALLTDLLVNPAMLISVQLITLWDYVAVRIRHSALQDSLILRGLTRAQAKTVVLLGSLRRVKAGETVVRQGEPGEDMYLILSGAAEVSLDDETGGRSDVARLEDGAIFGEMALLGEGVRSATVVAASDAELLRIDDRALYRVQRRNPRIAAKLYENIARVLSERVRAETRKAHPAD